MAKEIGNWSKHRPARARPVVRPRGGRTPEEILAPHLKPGEKIIWSARGRGHTGNRPAPGISDLNDLVRLFVAILLLIVFLPGVVSAFDVTRLALVGVVLVVGGDIVLRSLFGHSLEVYGLTSHRLIVASALFGGQTTYAGANIHFLCVVGGPGRGDVVFRNPVRDWLPLFWKERGLALVGVDNPGRVADLIASTLAPGVRREKA